MTLLTGPYDPAQHLADGGEVFAEAWCKGWEIPPPQTVSAWSDAHRIISRKAGAEHGRWRTDRMPHLQEVMDCFSAESTVREVDFMKSTQVGGTEVINNVCAYTIDHAPAPMMVLMPTLGLGELWSKQRFAPMAEEMECLAGKIAPARSRDADNTTLLKGFPGGVLAIAGANSSSGLRSMPVKILLADEVDEYDDDLNDQGSALALAERRTSTFARRKIARVSTPTVKGNSRIEAGFLRGDQRRRFVPCPFCRTHLVLDVDRITDAGDYLCLHCNTPIAEHHKPAMFAERSACATCGDHPLRVIDHVDKGRLVFADVCGCGRVVDPPAPDGAFWQPSNALADPLHRSYHIWAAYSSLGLGYSWREIAEMRAKAKADPDLAVTFANTILGETHDSATLRIEASELARRAEKSGYQMGAVPAGALLLTVGVDVQGNRFEVFVWGWGRGERAFLVDAIAMPADPTCAQDYDVLDGVMERAFANRYGTTLRPVMMAIDSGNWTHEVYNYVRRTRHPVMAVKGLSTGGKQVVHRFTEQDVRSSGRVIRNGVRLWPVGTDTAKNTLIARLVADEEREPARRAFVFPEDTPADFFDQLTAEAFDERRKRWAKLKGRRNEALDGLIYAYAAALHPKIGLHKMRDAEWRVLEEAYEPGMADLLSTAQAAAPVSRETKNAPAPPPRPAAAPAADNPFASSEWSRSL